MPFKTLTIVLATLMVISVAGLCVEPGNVTLSLQDEAKKTVTDDDREFSEADLEFFESKVRPLLDKHCFKCHGPDEEEPEGGLIIGSRKSLLQGGDTGPAIVPDHPEKSLLIEAINYLGDYEMPPASKLPQESIDILTKWVAKGAAWPAHEDTELARDSKFDLEKRKSEHWCWQPIADPTVPKVKTVDWPRDSIDNFVLNKIEKTGLVPAAEADRRTWIRRAYFDLIGLPPTPEEIESFVTDSSANAYETVVDRLLDSPRFGELWARRWMDLIRYAETCGHEFDYPIPHAFRYRDYLIRAFNADVPYDEFVTEHIAGDLVASPRLHPEQHFDESILGTGFWFLGEATHGPVDVRGDEAGRIDNQIDVMSKTFLGLTVACARCHDHKFDAISTRDFYALSGFLQSSRRQLTFVDEGQEVEKHFAIVENKCNDLDRKTSDFANSFVVDQSLTAEYLTAAIEYLSHDKKWTDPRDAIVHQGEKLKTLGVTGGKVQPQALHPQNGFKWQDNRQVFWIDGKKDDRLEFEFNVPKAGFFEVACDFTKASDYATIEVSIDDEVVTKSLDLYDTKITKTGRVSIARLNLAQGNHKLAFRILDQNKKAVPKNVVGLDYLQLRPVDESENASNQDYSINKVAARYENVNPDSLANWINAIKDQSLESLSHPLHIAREVAKQEKLAPEFFEQIRKQLADTQAGQESKRSQSVLFENFDGSSFDGWFRTGWSFDSIPTQFGESDVTRVSELLARPGIAHSGRRGGKFYGVLRSPTFTIDHRFLHYRLAAKDIQIRLIIDGFTLDVNNALLFNGATFKFSSDGKFRWHQQGQDIGNYLGHRAHIEIIDHGNGFAAVDEIWFSNEGGFGDLPSETGKSVLANAFESDRKSFAIVMAKAIVNCVKGDSTESADIINWMSKYRLVEIDEELRSQLADYRQVTLKKIRTPQFAVAITDGTGEDEFVFVRGNHKQPSEVAPRQLITAIDAKQRRFTADDGSGRLDLARQLVDPENPLTSRVIVNRLWHHLFGRGIVPSCDNFGVLGQRPSHPELLDHLAKELVREKWSLKAMMRRMVLSSTYRMSSKSTVDATEIDPTNSLLYKARIRRLSGEQIRDSILKISGKLNEKMFGPGVSIHLTPFMQGRGRPGKSGPLDGDGRRSVYIEVRRNFLSPMMLAFDTPIPFNTIGRRNVSNVPAQALIMMNDPMVIQQAEHWARKIIDEKLDRDSMIKRLYLQALGREPSAGELETALTFLESQRTELGIPSEMNDEQKLNVWRDLCHVILNIKEFIYIK